MIVRMKKLTLLTSESAREEFLLKLRRLGTVHIKNVAIPSADGMSSLEDAISQAAKAISILGRYGLHDAHLESIRWNASEIPDNVKKVTSLAAEREDVVTDLRHAENRMEWFKPWGPFNPHDLEAFQEKGIFVRLFRIPKAAFKKIQERKDIHIINKDKQYVYIAQASDNPDEFLPFDEVRPVRENFEDLYNRHESLQMRIGEIDAALRLKARAADSLKEYLSTLEKKHTFLDAMYGMKEEEGFSYLQGFCPVDKVKDMVALAKSHDFGYLIEEPDEPENVPTLIRNPRWISIIKPVFKFMNTIPGYKEYDISPWFLMFFSLFFAMLVGDGGYGLLFLGLTFLVRRKLKKAPREPFLLMYVLSFATIIWGAITGTWFGAETIARLPFLNSLIIERVNSFAAGNQNFMIFFCFVIGIIQLSIAHFIIAFRRINTLKALAEVGWILTLWGLFFTAGTLVIDKPFPAFAGYLLIAGISLVLLFSNPQKNIIKGMLISLGNIPLRVISSFGDIVSYLRLFAVGYASVVLASTFNNMAVQVGFNNVISSVGAALILFFGHALNIALCLMAVIVHGMRLNMLEFSGQMGMEWSGKDYAPFREV